MTRNYYYLAIVLPKLSVEERPEINLAEFEQLLKENLYPEDYAKTKRLRWFFDLRNVRAFWQGDPHENWGTLTPFELEEALFIQDEALLPSYLYDYLREYHTQEERLTHFHRLISCYFTTEAEENYGFVGRLRRFERNLRLVMTAYRAKQLGRSLRQELEFEPPEDPLVALLLAQADEKEFELPKELAELKPLLHLYEGNPLELQKGTIDYMVRWIDEALIFDYFSIDRILGYMAQFILIDRFTRMDKARGAEILEKTLKEVS